MRSYEGCGFTSLYWPYVDVSISLDRQKHLLIKNREWAIYSGICVNETFLPPITPQLTVISQSLTTSLVHGFFIYRVCRSTYHGTCYHDSFWCMHAVEKSIYGKRKMSFILVRTTLSGPRTEWLTALIRFPYASSSKVQWFMLWRIITT